MISRLKLFSMIFLLCCLAASAQAANFSKPAGEIKTGIEAEGACAIVGMSAEQCQLAALQRARAAAIEQAAGVSVTSATLVTNLAVAADFIKSYSRGFIVREKAAWLPIGQYQKDSSTVPIPEYRVRINADVYVPARKAKAAGLKAKINNAVFRAGEKARISVDVRKDANIAIFNIMADDRVALVFPNDYESGNLVFAGKNFVFPARDARVELEMQTLAGHRKDAEAFLVVAWDRERGIAVRKIFPSADPMPLDEFFRRLMEIADNCEEVILPYEVIAQ
ncbi:MAG: DUF4384 domain-containing protein [Smithellaceae bacterium]|jgi:hypothetical protein|nr:DUF4384 domain-containing protein [Smithellaceae bacterium]